MTGKQARNHHYVPQFYLRNFSSDEKVFAFNTKNGKLFSSSPRNIASERDLYRLEGPEPQLAEKMFGEIETAITPILNNIISTEKLPAFDSDEFISLMWFISLMVVRHPGQLTKFEEFMKTVMQRSVEIFAHHISAEGKTLGDGQKITKEQANDAVEALNAGRIKIHIPRDHSLTSSLKTAETIAETLVARSWTLAISSETEFMTSSSPVLLVWDDLSLHLKYPTGFGVKNTTVYFPISPKLLMIGKFEQLKSISDLDVKMAGAINGLHGIFSPLYLIARSKECLLQIGAELIKFESLESEYKKIKTLIDAEPSDEKN